MKKILAIVLAVFMMAGIIPAGVFAGEETVSVEISMEIDLFLENEELSAKVYVPEGIDFDSVGYCIRYNNETTILRGCEEAEYISVSRTLSDADEGILARSLYVSPAKEIVSQNGKVLVDTITFRMMDAGNPGIEFILIERDADFGMNSTFLILNGIYYNSEGVVNFDTTMAQAFAKAKSDAVKALEEYKNPEEYREAEKEALAQIVEAGKAAIESAGSIGEVEKALADAKAAADAVKTDAELTEEEQPEYLPGDVNLDGKVDAADATQILRYVNGKSCVFTAEDADTELLEETGDVNGDGKVDAADATQILRYVNGKSCVFTA